MNRMHRLFLAFLMALPAIAQDQPARDANQDGGGKGGMRPVDVELVEKGEKEGFDPESGAKGKFTLDKTPQVLTARGHCRFDGSIQPRRLLPGQTGRMLVTMMFEGDTVMTAPSTLQLKGAQGGMAVGAWSVLPAQKGTVASAYRGQPVYDNWAVIEASVTMPADARLGEKRNAVLELEFDLNSGSTGQALGHFRDSINIPCEVGTTANPVVSAALPVGGSAPKSAAAPTTQPEAGSTNSAATETQAEPATRSTQAAEVTDPVRVPTDNGSSDLGSSAELAPTVEESTKDQLLIVGGGAAFLIVLVAVFLLRRR